MTRDDARTAVEARIFDGTPFTFMQLSPLCDDVAGMTDSWRIADAAIQRNRKKGFIAFVREGRQTIWSLTDAGRAERARRADQTA